MSSGRASIHGKFITINDKHFYIKGVCYGWFPPEENNGVPYPRPEIVRKDFKMMKQAGINTIRTFDPPPDYLLNIADELEIKVIVGIWLWHKYVYHDSQTLKYFQNIVRETVSRCEAHPCVLMYCIGSELPSELVRWYGHTVIEQFLRELYQTAKHLDPHCIITYANFPTTDYLHLEFLDVICFNVYIYYQDGFQAYLSRLHHIAGDKPLLLGEIGVDTLRNGEALQAEILEWAIKSSLREGLCGVTIFQWTDKWWRGGNTITDWKFGIVTEDRVPKAAYHTITPLLSKSTYSLLTGYPLISIIVAAYNGEHFMDECLHSLTQLNYPHTEIIVVDDGSTDATPLIAAKYPVKLVRNGQNHGLSEARNIGLKAAQGEVIAFTDADCRVDAQWLFYIASRFEKLDVSAVGGPNLTPSDDGFLAHSVGDALGSPKSVLIDDREAEHVPGCNMAFRKTALKDVGGFDPIYRAAGDDVDVCWRMRDQGYTIEYVPGAVVWHHRRASIKAYFKQQFGYGVAEALLGKKHPEKSSRHGLKWVGKIYGALPILSFSRPRIYYAPFPYVYMPIYGVLSYLPLTLDWYIVATILLGLIPFSLWFLLLSSALISVSIVTCLFLGRKANNKRSQRRGNKLQSLLTITFLNFLWPIARGLGRMYGRTRLR